MPSSKNKASFLRLLAAFQLLAACMCGFAQDTWTWRNPKPQGSDLNAVASDGAHLYVGVGAYGAIVSSTNGTAWASQSSGTSADLYAIAYGNGYFVAAGKGGVILRSADGVNWTPATSGTSSDLFGVAFGYGMFVAVGKGGTLLTSLDAVIWDTFNSGTGNNLNAVCFDGDTEYVAVGDSGTVVRSQNYGMDWVAETVGSAYTLSAVAVSADRIVAAGSTASAGVICTYTFASSTWAWASGGTTNALKGLIFDGTSAFMAVGLKGTIIGSVNGLTWSAKSSGTTINLTSVGWGLDGFMAVGKQGLLLTAPTAASAWQNRQSGALSDLRAVLFTGTNFLASGMAGTILTSPDGLVWTNRSSGVTNELAGLATGRGLQLAVGSRGKILTSTNGIAWAAQTNTLSSDLYSIVFGTNRFVTVGAAGAVATSPDGTNWFTQTGLPASAFSGLAYGNGLFVAAGYGGKIYYSADGTNWVNATSGTAQQLYGVAYGDGQFAAVGFRGTICTSSNGVTWSSRTIGATNDLRGVVHDGRRFVAVGLSGVVLTSTDGTNWSSRTPNAGGSLRGVAFGNEQFVAVGDFGAVLSSPRAGLPDVPVITSATNATTLAGLPFSYQITVQNGATNYAATNLPAGLTINATNGLISGTPLEAGEFAVALTAWNAGGAGTLTLFLTVAKQTQTITFAALTDRYLDESPLTLSSLASSALPVQFTVAGPATLAGSNQLSLTATGLVSVTASQPGNNIFAAASNVLRSFTVRKRSQVITFPALTDCFLDQTPVTLLATVNSPLAITYTVTGPATVNGNQLQLTGLGLVEVTAKQPGNTFYEPATNQVRSFTVRKRSQVITFPALADRFVDQTPVTLQATASSSLAVIYNITGPATLNGNQLQLTGVGLVTVTAAQPGNAFYDPATNQVRSFTVTKRAQTITLPGDWPSARPLGSAPLPLNATASSGLTVAYSVSGSAKFSGGALALTGPGQVTLRVNQAGNAFYLPAPEVASAFTVNQQTQTITFPEIGDRTIDTGPIELAATASSGLPITYTLTGPATLTSNRCVLATGLGQVSVTAWQAGDAIYAAAADVTRSFTVRKRTQTVAFAAIPTQTMGGPPLTLVASSSAGLPVSFALASGPGRLENNTYYLTAAGQVTLRAAQAGNGIYSGVTNEQTFSVLKRSQTITFPAIASPQSLGDPPLVLPTAASSGLPISYRVASGDAAVLAGNVVTPCRLGHFVIEASQPGNGVYTAAVAATIAFDVYQLSWTNVSFARTEGFHSVVYGGDRFYAYTPTQVYTSLDGLSWSNRPVSVSSPSLYSVAYGNGVFVAFQRMTSYKDPSKYWWVYRNDLYRSTDGVNFTLSYSQQPTKPLDRIGEEQTFQGYSVFFRGNSFFFAGNAPYYISHLTFPSSSEAWVGQSSNGSTWQTYTFPFDNGYTASLQNNQWFPIVAGFACGRSFNNSTNNASQKVTIVTSYVNQTGDLWETLVRGWTEYGGYYWGVRDGNIYKATYPAKGYWSLYSSLPTAIGRLETSGGKLFACTADGRLYSLEATGWQLHRAKSQYDRQVASIAAGAGAFVAIDENTGLIVCPALNVAPPGLATNTALSSVVGHSFEWSPTASNSPSLYGALGLPPGLSINSTNGTISGTPTVAGDFAVTVTAANPGGNYAVVLNLTVLPLAPVITSPANDTGTAGWPFAYQITADNSPTGYRTAGLPSGLAVNPTTGLVSGTPTVAGTFNVTLTATNLGGSGSKSLQITLQPDVPQIINQPKPILAAAGSPAAVSVYAVAAYPLGFQWQKQSVKLPGQTNAALSWNSIQPGDAADYRVVVSNAFGVVTSAVATVTVGSSPQITTHPVSQTNAPGASVGLSVQASGLAPLTYQWRFNGAVLPGATYPNLQLTNLQAASVGFYQVEVRNPVGSVVSSNALVALYGVPVILTVPLSLTVPVGSNAVFQVQAAGAALLSYQWQKGGTALTNTARITGVDSNILTLFSLVPADAGGYAVVVSNPYGTATASAELRLATSVPPVIVSGTAARLPNGQFQFSVSSEPGRPVEVWSSTNLVQWSWLNTFTNQSGTAPFTDANTNLSRRFYRLRQ